MKFSQMAMTIYNNFYDQSDDNEDADDDDDDDDDNDVDDNGDNDDGLVCMKLYIHMKASVRRVKSGLGLFFKAWPTMRE